MQIKLYSKPDREIPPKKMVCLNRGIHPKQVNQFLKNTMEDVNSYEPFEDLMFEGAKILMNPIICNKKIFVLVDCDPDGWTSSAVLINYLYELFPAWTQNNLTWGLHEGKQHGLKDYIDRLEKESYAAVIIPDAGSNDLEEIERLHNVGTDVLILDHHIIENDRSKFAVTINSQDERYPNKALSGVGVVYKFCQYLDDFLVSNKLINKGVSDKFKDLVAIGLMADMMDIRSLETKELIFDGLKEENIKNPLIAGLTDKNIFALHKPDYIPSSDNDLYITPMGAAFFIIPLINAMSRSGSMEEKELVFNSLLTMKAFEIIPSNKRGHKEGETERRVDQALRCTTNVKNRQTRAEEQGMEILCAQAQSKLDNKVMVFVVGDEIAPTIGGLVANKLAAKYQRPVAVIRKMTDGTYAGSMRGYTATGIESFKDIAMKSQYCAWCMGHENAAGICLTYPDKFIKDMNELLKDVSTEITYYVDYMYDANSVDGDTVMALAELNDYLGTGFARPQIYIYDFKFEDFLIMKSNTLKFHLPCGIDVIKFAATEEEIDFLNESKGKIMNIVCKCNINEWCGERNPQLMCLDYEIKEPITPTGWNSSWDF